VVYASAKQQLNNDGRPREIKFIGLNYSMIGHVHTDLGYRSQTHSRSRNQPPGLGSLEPLAPDFPAWPGLLKDRLKFLRVFFAGEYIIPG
jgi:hypothetical protein